MKKPNSGWSFHCHHDILIEWCLDYRGRVKHIKEYKPENERALRLKLFRLIPPGRMEKIFGRKAYAEWQKALEKNLPAILTLHKKLCGCDWGNRLTGNIFARVK